MNSFSAVNLSNRYNSFLKNRKAGFLVLDITWKVFSQTGNIETYLLLKEMESLGVQVENGQMENEITEMDDTETFNEI